MLYSVKMRSAQGGPHEQGGRHISGAERILSEEKIEQAIVAMLHRAQKHQRGMADFIINLRDSMRGAMLLDADTGLRVDSLGERGVRVSKMDCDNSERYEARLLEKGLFGDHVREALVLASKVASAVGVVAELCWSDDPEYVTGYVASAKYGYKRIPVLKEYGNPIGGRVFFVEHGTDVQKLITYLQDQVVLIRPEDK